MLSPTNQERLNQAVEDTATSAAALKRLVKKLAAVADTLTHVSCTGGGDSQENQLNADEVERLLRLNRHLAKMEIFLNTLATTLTPALADQVADPSDPMDDFEIDAEMHYTLREDDPEWSEDSDNFLTSREEFLKPILCRYSMGDDHRQFMPNLEAINTEPHCWSFHDLWDHEYGLAKPCVPLRDCLRLGKVWVDVLIRQQYWLNLDTGEWDKDSNQDSKSLT